MISLAKLTILLAVATSQAHAQCYYAANKLASSDYIPCGDTSNGQEQSCCHLGDNCLVDGVCFSLSTGMTYIAGCTDSSYEDERCGAQQCSKDSQVQGIAMPCSSGVWQCCGGTSQQGTEPARTDPSSCECDTDAQVAINGPVSFGMTALLPQATDGQIVLVNSAGSSTAKIPVPTISSSSSSSSTSSTESSSSTSSSSSSSSSSPSTSSSSSPSSSTSTSPDSSPTNAATSSSSSEDGSSPTTSSPSSTSSSTSDPSTNSPNLKLILGLSIPFSLIGLALLGFLAFLFWRRRREDKNHFGSRGWDPFRHQPAEGRESRSSAVWDNSYNSAGVPVGPVAGDDVAEAVRRNAEQHRHQRGDTGGLRPMSEMEGFVPWKRSP